MLAKSASALYFIHADIQFSKQGLSSPIMDFPKTFLMLNIGLKTKLFIQKPQILLLGILIMMLT